MSSGWLPVILLLIVCTAFMWATAIGTWYDKRRIRAAINQGGGKVEWIRMWSDDERIRSWRDLAPNQFGPRRYRVRRVDPDGQTRTSDVHVGMFSGVKWLGPDE